MSVRATGTASPPRHEAHQELPSRAQRIREVDPLAVPGRTGVFFSGGSLPHLPGDLDRMRVEEPAEYFGLEIGQDKDYLASTVASRKTLLAY